MEINYQQFMSNILVKLKFQKYLDMFYLIGIPKNIM